jgi:branched-chain amino acid aminotransferase
MDHLALYGDGCFEGVLITNDHVFLWKEHLLRLRRSAETLHIDMPYSDESLTSLVLRTARDASLEPEDRGYLRLVISRGMGDLGINPRKCVTPTLFGIVSRIALFPQKSYDEGIQIGITRHTRRPMADILDPNIKSTNYLNNVMALIEGTQRGQSESLMLNPAGFVAEATVENVFSVATEPRQDVAGRRRVLTPGAAYCLEGITRSLVMQILRDEGHDVDDRADLLPIDLVGPGRECFVTGTGAGVLPVSAIGDVAVGDGHVGPVTRSVIEAVRVATADPRASLPVGASAADIARYLAEPCFVRACEADAGRLTREACR